jgi:hypothetical protein
MTGPSPWAAPPETGPQQAVFPPPPSSIPPQSGPAVPPVPPPRTSRRRFPWLLIGGAVVILIAVIAATAAVTYALTRNTNVSNVTAPPQFGAADQTTAKQQLCRVFDVSARGQRGQGGVRVNGEVNVQLVLRTVNSVVAVQNALTPAVPQDVGDAARKYIDTSLELTTAATGDTPADELNRLTDVSNEATYSFADACGLRR